MGDIILHAKFLLDMKPIFYTSKLLGMAPFTIVATGSDHTLEYSRLSLVYSILLCVSLNVGELFFTQRWFEDADSGSIFKITSNYVTLALFSGGILVHIFSLMNSRKLHYVLNKVVRLEAFVVADVRFTQQRVFWFSMLELILAIVLPVIINIIVGLNPRLFEDLPASNLTLTDCYFFSIMFIMQLQFMNLVLKLFESYSSINFVLGILRGRGSPPLELTSSQGKHLLHNPAGTVRQLRKLHCTLCDVLETLNSVYSIQILVCATQHFIGITFSIYSIVVHTIGDEVDVAENLAWNVTTSFWLICDSLIILGVASSCCFTAQQANSTSIVVHKLLNEDCDVRTKEEKFERDSLITHNMCRDLLCHSDQSNRVPQLQLFSMQLLHRKIQFTACGFFDLDYTFIHSIVGAVTTYLVILIEFQLTYGKMDTKNMPTYAPKRRA